MSIIIKQLCAIVIKTISVRTGLICSDHCIGVEGPRREVIFPKKFPYFSCKIYVVGTQKNRLIETVILSTHNIHFDSTLRK